MKNITPGQRSEGPFSRREEGWELGGKEIKKKAKTKDGGNQAANFRKPNIILILADDVGGILIMPHSMWFID